jgi:hypothetical protein
MFFPIQLHCNVKSRCIVLYKCHYFKTDYQAWWMDGNVFIFNLMLYFTKEQITIQQHPVILDGKTF